MKMIIENLWNNLILKEWNKFQKELIDINVFNAIINVYFNYYISNKLMDKYKLLNWMFCSI